MHLGTGSLSEPTVLLRPGLIDRQTLLLDSILITCAAVASQQVMALDA